MRAKQKLILWTGGLSIAALCLVGCGGDSVSCDDACGKLVDECHHEDGGKPLTMSDCLKNCEAMKGITRSSFFDGLGDCIMETDCETVDPGECMQQAAQGASEEGQNRFFSALCDKVMECDPQTTDKEACITLFKGLMGDFLMLFNVLKDSVLNCLVDCLDGLACDAGEDAANTCMANCGVDIFDDEQ